MLTTRKHNSPLFIVVTLALTILAATVWTGCDPYRVPDSGTSGASVLDCGQDPVCASVEGLLESVRWNIGGWCGTPDMMASETLINDVGLPGAPYLEQALDDRDWPVATFAGGVLHELGEAARVDAWCAAHNAEDDLNYRPLCDPSFWEERYGT